MIKIGNNGLLSRPFAKNDIIETLGLEKNNIIKKAENYTRKYYVSRTTTTTNHKVESDFKMLSAEEAEDFFGTLGKKVAKIAMVDQVQVWLKLMMSILCKRM